MLTDRKYDKMGDFLKSVRDQIKERGKITAKQKLAVQNIYGRGGR